MASSDEVQRLFRHTDFVEQKRMLTRSLELCGKAVGGDPHGLEELRERSESHSRRRLNIKPHLYDIWLDSLILTAAECDPDWTSELEEHWRRILGHVIRRMIAAY